MINESLGQSVNQPYFCAQAIWNSDGITFADESVVGVNPYGLFVSINNTVYVSATNLNQIQIWFEGSNSPSTTLTDDFNTSYAICASMTGDVYIDNGGVHNRIDKWEWNDTSTVIELYVNGSCFGLFVDMNDTLYCSIESEHQVLQKTINDDVNMSSIIAGTGIPGNALNMLNGPRGIFVDLNSNLFVADCQNDRIQKFLYGQLTGKTIVGNGATGTITLNCPTGVILDGNGYLFITDYANHRIIGSGPNGYRCIIGCSGTTGSLSYQLNYPTSLNFDSYGNLFVADMGNSRIQKFILATNSCGISYNQPKFCASATWNSNGMTFVDDSMIGIQPYNIFINKNNSVYIADRSNNNIQMWSKGATSPTIAAFSGLTLPFSVFVTITGDIYADNGFSNNRIDKWSPNTPTSVAAMDINGTCYGLFVDIYDNIYCSLGDYHQVIKKSFNDDVNTSSIVAGTGMSGSSSDMLSTPQGIFVTTRFNLYVADSANNRIQLFRSKQLNATTVVGYDAPGTMTLAYPTAIVLDSQGYLFIVDTDNNRIIGSSANGFRCIVGCSTTSGSASDQLNAPWSLSFDSSGNLFVADTYNNRIQKFLLTANTCGRSYNLPKFCTYVKWNSNAITFADNLTVSSYPSDIYINTKNTIYITATNFNQVQVWFQGNTSPSTIISTDLNSPYAVFVAIMGEIYIDNSLVNNRIDKWTLNATNSTIVMYTNDLCYDIFVDIYDNLYCSLENFHVVIKKSFNDDASTSTIVAGNGTNGSSVDMLDNPRGIFLDTNFNLYVADCGNNRIQKFQSGHLNATTVLGNQLIDNLTLNCPTSVVLDAAGYLYITDSGNHRIISTGPNGYQCIVGCSGTGSAADQLYNPRSLSFDSYGNIYVTDTGNERIQKFSLATNSCYQTTTTTQYIPTSTMNLEISTTNIQSTEMPVTTASSTNVQSSDSFLVPTCPSSTSIGPNCNVSVLPCDMLHPCENSGTCLTDYTTLFGYNCLCPSGFSGTDCEYDYRACQPDTCWNNGTCSETTNTTFFCTCAPGWQNNHCEIKINFCKNITCLNQGICRPLVLDFLCECLAGSYSGRYCEITSSRVTTLQAVSKSFASVAIVAIVTVAIFIVIMDILTYCFRIDLTHHERELMRQKTALNKQKRHSTKRYVSVDISTIEVSPRSIVITSH